MERSASEEIRINRPNIALHLYSRMGEFMANNERIKDDEGTICALPRDQQLWDIRKKRMN
jgi:hypothetical protein